MPINLNEMAVEIAEREGKKEQVNIAQIKEILAICLDLLSGHTNAEVVELLDKRR